MIQAAMQVLGLFISEVQCGCMTEREKAEVGMYIKLLIYYSINLLISITIPVNEAETTAG